MMRTHTGELPLSMTKDGGNKELALALIKADSEKKVIAILKRWGYWDDSDAWYEYGDNPRNSSIIANQQSSADSALVEKLLNSVDAVMMRECLKKGIIPSSDNAPQAIAEAQKDFFNISDGKLSSIGFKQRSFLAEDILLVATGSKESPSLSIIDKGEGHSPKRMPETILSLTRDNKIKIPFVQGKFGMGGSGVLRFCSTENSLMLVISKRSREIAKETDEEILGHGKDETRNLWGVTIVRREDPKEKEKSSHYTYLAPDNKILSFDSEKLPILENMPPNPARSLMNSGTYIKLYEYNIETRLRSRIAWRLYYRLALLMPDIPLPIRMVECRDYKGHSPEITLAGLSVRLDEDKRENLEPEFKDPIKIPMNVEGQELSYFIYVFKPSKKENYASGEGVVFSVNGQSHGSLAKDFFANKAVNMSYLADSILVIVDCSKMSTRGQEKLFMPSRDRLSKEAIRYAIQGELANRIKNHSGLKELQNRRRDEARKDRIENEKSDEDFFNSIAKKHPNLTNYFSFGKRIPNPFSPKPVQLFEGKKFPKFFNLVKKYPENSPKVCPINRKLTIKFETDAENDYFSRGDESAKFTLELNGEVIQSPNPDLWNGEATLKMNLPSDVKIGEILYFEAKVTDTNPSRINPFVSKFYVSVGKEVESSPSGPSLPKKPKLGWPKITSIREEDWGKVVYKDFNFNRFSALEVRRGGDEKYDFFVNLDNIYLKTEIKTDHKADPIELEDRYKYGLALLGMSILHFGNEDKGKKGNNDNKPKKIQNSVDFSSQKHISKFTEIISPVLLTMIKELGGEDNE